MHKPQPFQGYYLFLRHDWQTLICFDKNLSTNGLVLLPVAVEDIEDIGNPIAGEEAHCIGGNVLAKGAIAAGGIDGNELIMDAIVRLAPLATVTCP